MAKRELPNQKWFENIPGHVYYIHVREEYQLCNL